MSMSKCDECGLEMVLLRAPRIGPDPGPIAGEPPYHMKAGGDGDEIGYECPKGHFKPYRC